MSDKQFDNVLKAYRAAYNNNEYKAVSRALAEQLDISPDFLMITNIREQMHNDLMNLIIDACMEQCGESRYDGSSYLVWFILSGESRYLQLLVANYIHRFQPL